MASALILGGCATTGYTGPRLLTWNVAIDSIPQGAEISWSVGGHEKEHSLGKAPVTASIPLSVSERGYFNAVSIYATVGRARSAVSTSTLLNGRWDDTLHRPDEFVKLPSKLTVNAYKAYEFDIVGNSMLPEYEKNPERWTPYVTSLRGKVLSIQESGAGCTVQLLTDDDSRRATSKLVVLNWPNETMQGVVEGTYLKVLGSVQGRVSGTNAFGGSVTALTFNAYGYVANWMLSYASQNYLVSKKDYFDRWAQGSLFTGEGLVSAP